VSCLLKEGRSILPSPFEDVGKSLTEFPVVVHGEDGGSLWVKPMTIVSETSPEGERLRPLKWSAMNLRLPKRMVSPRKQPPHDKHSLLVATTSGDDGTIKTFRGKAHCKSSFLVCQLLVFFAPVRYNVVKITRSCSEVVLQTTKQTIVYPGSSLSLEVIVLRLAV
jgi:hypothetical protein